MVCDEDYCFMENTCKHVLQRSLFMITRKHLTMSYHHFFLFPINYYNRLTMNFMRIPLAHSAESESSSGKSELQEGTTLTWEANSCHQGWCFPPSSIAIYVYALLYVYCSCFWISFDFYLFIWSPPWYWSIDYLVIYLFLVSFIFSFVLEYRGGILDFLSYKLKWVGIHSLVVVVCMATCLHGDGHSPVL